MNILYWLVFVGLCLVAGLACIMICWLVYLLICWRRRQKREASERAAIERGLAAIERAAIERNLEERCRPPIAQKPTQRSEFPHQDAHGDPAKRSQRAG